MCFASSPASPWQPVVLLSLGLLTPACALLGPTCAGRRDGGPVTLVTGVAPAGGQTSLVLRYETAGSQNTIDVRWPGAGTADGARVWFEVTRPGCETGPDTAATPVEACGVLAQGGQRDDGPLVSSLVVTHGRGNPLVLGTPPDYRVWATNAAAVPVPFTLDVRWSYGPDC